MINKEELLNEIYRLERYTKVPTLSFMPDVATVSLNSVIKIIERLDNEEDEGNNLEDAMYNVVHKIADMQRGVSRALNELTEQEQEFVLEVIKDKSNEN